MQERLFAEEKKLFPGLFMKPLPLSSGRKETFQEKKQRAKALKEGVAADKLFT
jgi:hypothetical protein